MGPLHPQVQGALSCLRQAELLQEAGRARLVPSHGAGRASRSVARALRGLADRLDGLDAAATRTA